MSRSLMLAMIVAMIFGLLAGVALNGFLPPQQTVRLADGLSIITTIFLRLIRMIVAPLVLTTLTVGIARMENAAEIGRIGARTIVWFIAASLISLGLGLVLVDLLQPGSGFAPTHPLFATQHSSLRAGTFNLTTFITHLVPSSIVEAMANNEILQIVVFACFAGAAISSMQQELQPLIVFLEQIATLMLKVTNYVMLIAPAALFSAIASTIATQGPSVLSSYAKFVGGYYLGLIILWSFLFAVAYVVWPSGFERIWRAVREPVVLAFSTASSEAAYPRLWQGLQDTGLPRQLVSFVLPLGYSFNLDGSMMYLTFATMFIAQIYHIDMPILQQVGVLLLMMVTSKGVAGVPRGSLVVLAATLPVFHLPESGLLIVLAVDQLLDMGRSATNIVGNSVACVVVQQWSGKSVEAREASGTTQT
jgi:Na+/H+-dicarboxylate symporter